MAARLGDPERHRPSRSREVANSDDDAASLGDVLHLHGPSTERLVGQAVVFGYQSDERIDHLVAMSLELLGLSRTDAQRIAHRPLGELVASTTSAPVR